MAQHIPSTAETIKQYKKASANLRKRIKDNPQEAKDFLLRAGILVKSKSAPSGATLAPRFRSAG